MKVNKKWSNIRAGVADILFATIINTKYTRSKINYITIFILSFILRNLMDCIIYALIQREREVFNFIISVIITVSLTISWIYFEDVILKYKHNIQCFTDYILDNYTFDLYKIWRKRIIVSTSIVLILISYTVELSSYWFRISILRFLTTCLIIDSIDNYQQYRGIPGFLRKYFTHLLSRPRVEIFSRNTPVTKSYYRIPKNTQKHKRKKSRKKSENTKVAKTGSGNKIFINGKYVNIDDDYHI